MYFLTFSKKSVSASELQRQLGHKRMQVIDDLKADTLTGRILSREFITGWLADNHIKI
jgi:hypothetical protein